MGARFDAAPVRETLPNWWVAVLARVGVIVPLATAVATAGVLFAGTRLREELQRVCARLGQPRWSWSFLTSHLVGFLLFVRLTAFVFEGELAQSVTPELWVGIWLLTGVGTVALGAIAVVPSRVFLVLMWRIARLMPLSALIGATAWGVGQITAEWWNVFRSATFWLLRRVLALAVADLVVQPADYLIGTERFMVEIAPQCSGYEGIGLIGVFLAGYLWFFRRSLRFPRAFVLLPIGMAAAFVANVGRIVALVIVGTRVSPAVAVGGFHAYTGSLLFCALALGIATLSQRSTFFSVSTPQNNAVSHRNASAAYLVPLLAVIATSMVTGAASTGNFDALYPLRVLVAGAVFWAVRREYAGGFWSWSWTSLGVGALVLVVWIASAPRVDPGDVAWPKVLAGWPSGPATAWLIFRVLGFVIVAPLTEELAFRGYLTRRLISADVDAVPMGQFSWVSFLVSSVLFGALHQRLLTGTIAGMLYALVLYRRRTLSDAVVAHATTNALLVTYVLATGTWWLWG